MEPRAMMKEERCPGFEKKKDTIEESVQGERMSERENVGRAGEMRAGGTHRI